MLARCIACTFHGLEGCIDPDDDGGVSCKLGPHERREAPERFPERCEEYRLPTRRQDPVRERVRELWRFSCLAFN